VDLTVTPNAFQITTEQKQFSTSDMTIRETIKANPNASGKAIAEMCGTSVGQVYKAAHRLRKSEAHPALAKECEDVGLPVDQVGNYWYKGKHYSIHLKADKAPTYEEMKDVIIAEMQNYAPAYPKIKYTPPIDPHLLVIDPADVHIGKLARAFETGEDYDNQIAVQRIREGVAGILNKAQGWRFDKIMLVVGNDILHVDGPENSTTKGTRQDVGSMWFENFQIAKQIYIETIEKLLQIAPLHVQYDPSNHDLLNGFFLADTLTSWFHKAKNITFNTSIAHRKYMTYGKNLIGTTHGDGAKEVDLPLLMAQEAPKDWAECKHRYFYKHHIHHEASKDYGSVNVKTLRSPSGTDGWHHRNGYQHSPKAIEGFVHHPENGRIATITHLF
jgi:hypothetical protein